MCHDMSFSELSLEILNVTFLEKNHECDISGKNNECEIFNNFEL
jgi:hypothetical protein